MKMAMVGKPTLRDFMLWLLVVLFCEGVEKKQVYGTDNYCQAYITCAK